MLPTTIHRKKRLITDAVFFDEVDEGGPLDLDRLSVTVVHRQHEVKEVAFAQVARRLFLEVRSTQPNNKTSRYYHTITIKVKQSTRRTRYSSMQQASTLRELTCIHMRSQPVIYTQLYFTIVHGSLTQHK